MDLRYGSTTFDWPVRPGDRVLSPEGRPACPDVVAALRTALANPIAAPGLREWVRPGERVILLLPDQTRPAHLDRILPPLLEEIGHAAAVEAIFALGIHAPQTPETRARLLGPDARGLAARDHNADPGAHLVLLGRTSRGTPVEVDRVAATADRLILVGLVNFHYFAGFGGGRKAVVPGIASRAACTANHLLVLHPDRSGRHHGVGTGLLDGNPVAEDMEEALRFLPPAWSLNLLPSPEGATAGFVCGDAIAAHREACRLFADRYTVVVEEPRRLVVVSCGGAPRDLDLVQVHKAMEFARAAVADGGTLVVLAECPHGWGHPAIAAWFDHPDDAAHEAALRVRYEICGQTAWALREKAARFRILLVSAFPEDDARRAGMEVVADPAEAILRAGGGPAYLIPHGSVTHVRRSGNVGWP